MIRQFFDKNTSSYTYIVYNEGEAAIIDPVLEYVDQYNCFLSELGLQLIFSFETHTHADHITGACALKGKNNHKIVISANSEARGADHLAKDCERFNVGSLIISVKNSPGHTFDSVCYIVNREAVFTGDTLLIRKCGRTDFQKGSSEHMWNSIQELYKILPDNCIVYPGHDYNGFTCSTLREEKKFNKRIRIDTKSKSFIEIMNNLKLPRPKNMDVVIPANLCCGALR